MSLAGSTSKCSTTCNAGSIARRKHRQQQIERGIERDLAALEAADRTPPAEVDAKHHLIVAHAVANVGSDRSQLGKRANAAREPSFQRTARGRR